jgi:hypothetical protein
MKRIALTLSLLLLCLLSLDLAGQPRHGTPWAQADSKSSWNRPVSIPGAQDTIWIRRTNFNGSAPPPQRLDEIRFRGKPVDFSALQDEKGFIYAWEFSTTSPQQQGTTREPILLFGDGEPRPDTIWVEFRVSGGPAKLVWEEARKELGKFPQGKTVETSFRFRNDSEHALYISKVTTGTGAMVANWSSEPVMPHQEGIVGISFLTNGKMGKQNKCISVTYNGEPNGAVACFTCEVVSRPQDPPAPAVSPPVESADGHSGMAPQPNPVSNQLPLTEIVFDSTTIRFGTVRQGERLDLVYHFRNAGPNPLKIEAIKPSSGAVTATGPIDTIPPGGEDDIRVFFNTYGTWGDRNTTVSIVYNGNPSVIVLTLKGHVLEE